MSLVCTIAFSFDEMSPMANIAVPLLGVLLITVGMYMGIRKRRTRPGANTTTRDHVEDLRHKQAVRGDLEQLMIEVEQLAKRFGAQLDAKTMQMERLIEQANQKIAELKQLEAARRAAESIEPPQAPPEDNRPEVHSPDIHSPSPSPPPSPSPSPTPHPPSPPSDPDSVLKEKVYDLTERGCDPIEIARMLNEHVGKIELILALRKA